MKRIFVGLVTMTALQYLAIPAFALNAYEIMLNAYNLERGSDSEARLKMELIHKNGKKRIREVTIWRLECGEGNKSLIYFHKPAADRGTTFLTWEHKSKDNDQWLYLPGLKRIRRISAGDKHNAFMGTDFSYNDMAPSHPDEFTHKFSGEEKLDGTNCYLVESFHKSYLKDGKNVKRKRYEYSKVLSWVRKDNFMLVKSKMFDEEGTEHKEFRAHQIERINGIWTAMITAMKKLKSGHRTVFTIKNIKYNIGLKESWFSRRELSRER